MAIAADLLGVDAQVLRRLGEALDHEGTRPSGNQRRYSRNDLELLGHAVDLAAEGHNASGIVRILELERHVAELTTRLPVDR
ncbi:MAG: MerR family transcriptional regulator [Acidimicrobiales bacterium]|nr:MerR family transcriptional regulator [Acidimicrobiales bacterium]